MWSGAGQFSSLMLAEPELPAKPDMLRPCLAELFALFNGLGHIQEHPNSKKSSAFALFFHLNFTFVPLIPASLAFVDYRHRPRLAHIAPLYAVYNAGPKFEGKDIGEIANDYCQADESDDNPSNPERLDDIQQRLRVAKAIWGLMQSVKAEAEPWGAPQPDGLTTEALRDHNQQLCAPLK